MSTRGIIAIEDPDKTCRAIYVHFDMYLDGGGICLTPHYTTPDRVEKLLGLTEVPCIIADNLTPERNPGCFRPE